MTMDVKTALKLVLGAGISIGTNAILGTITGKAMGEAKKPTQACIWLASTAIGGLIAEKATDHLYGQVDDILTKIEERKRARGLPAPAKEDEA